MTEAKLKRKAGVDAYDRMIFAKGKGMNVETGEVVDMIDAGIVDPVKVTRMALEAAASVASIILTTDVLVGESYDSKK